MSDLEALPGDVRGIVDAGRLGAGPPADVEARMRARLAATTGVAIGAGLASVTHTAVAATVRTGLVMAKPLVAVAIAFAVGAAGGVGATLAWSHRAPADPRVAVAAAVAPARVQVTLVPVVIPTPIAVDQPPPAPRIDGTAASPRGEVSAAHPPVHAAVHAANQLGDLTAESALIERARTALERGDAASALTAVAEHEHRFPRGQLVEEREAVAVQALAAAGRADDARERARSFHARFANSLFDAVVDRAVSAEANGPVRVTNP